MRTTHVDAVMTRDVTTLSADLSRAALATHFEVADHSAYPVVEADGKLLGIVTRRDLINAADEDAWLRDIAEPQVITVGPHETVEVALQRMLEEGVDHLPVVDRGELVGIFTRTDVRQTRRALLALERQQSGWLARPAPDRPTA